MTQVVGVQVPPPAPRRAIAVSRANVEQLYLRRRAERQKTKIVVMQVTETVSDGLKREFKVVVPAADLATKADAKLGQLKDQVRINGFRPGKVPVAHLKRLYGRAVMAEMIEAAVREANAQIVTERGFKLVREPQVTLPTEQGAVEQVIEGKTDLAYTMAIEILPTIELADFKGIQLERMNAEVTDAEVDEAVQTIAEQSRPFAAKARGRARPRTATASPSISPARSTACRSRAAPAAMSRSISARARSFRASRSS